VIIEMNRDMLSRRLTRNGFAIVLAVNGQEGLELACSENPDLILLDMSLPVLDGWEAARQSQSRNRRKPGIRRRHPPRRHQIRRSPAPHPRARHEPRRRDSVGGLRNKNPRGNPRIARIAAAIPSAFMS